ncbi:tetratricopeptide repeat protein [bacterium]|nr:tetratricopeptide repeat protein [bacterium]
MKKVFLAVMFLVAARLAAQEQNAVQSMILDGKTQFEAAYKNWSRDEMINAKAIFERALAVEPENVDALYWKAYADYRLTIRSLYGSDKNEEMAEELVEEGIKTLEAAIKISPNHSECLALIGTLTGMKISFNPISGMWLGPKSNGYYDEAVKANPKNPRAFHLKGIGKLNTPAMFGGGADKAIPEFEKALALYKEQKTEASSLLPDWGYDECLTFTGNAYAALKDNDKAAIYYKEALAINPDSRQAKAGLAKLESAK